MRTITSLSYTSSQALQAEKYVDGERGDDEGVVWSDQCGVDCDEGETLLTADCSAQDHAGWWLAS